MIPVALDPRALHLAVAGRGERAAARLRGLTEGGAAPALFSDDPALGAAADTLPPADDALRGVAALWIVGLPETEAAPLAAHARALGVLVNVEDVPALCDFHNVAAIRRGDLLLTVSTAGRNPGLAARLRRDLEGRYGPEWSARTEALSRRRRAWRAEGRGMQEVAGLTAAAVEGEGWLR